MRLYDSSYFPRDADYAIDDGEVRFAVDGEERHVRLDDIVISIRTCADNTLDVRSCTVRDLISAAPVEWDAVLVQDQAHIRTHVMAKSKVAARITDVRLFDGVDVDVTSSIEVRRGKAIRTYVRLTAVGYATAALSAPIDEYDRLVQDALATLWAAGVRAFTTAQVAQAMGIDKPHPSQIAKVEASLDKQRRILCTVDFSEEVRGRGLTFYGEQVEDFQIEARLAPLDKAAVRTRSGRVTVGYIMTSAPPVFRHAAAIGQVITVPQAMLAIGAGSNTDANLIIKSHLIRRIGWMRVDSAAPRRIRYIHSAAHPERPGILERAGVNLEDRDARKRAADYVVSILEALVKMHKIGGYKEVVEGRQRVAVDIDVCVDGHR